MFVYSLFGLTGYFLYGDSIQDNILKNLDNGSIITIIIKICVSALIILTFPIMHYCCRTSVEKILFNNKPFSVIRWIFEAFIIISSSYILGMFVPRISMIFRFFFYFFIKSLTGSTTGVFIMFLFPSIIHLTIEKNYLKKSFSVLTIIISLILGILCTTSVILDIFNIKIN
jgi:hypothetical protein